MKQKRNLTEQLFLIYVLVISIIIISLGLVLPRTLLPIYENNLYNYLKQPLEFVEDDIDNNKVNSEIAYLYVSDKPSKLKIFSTSPLPLNNLNCYHTPRTLS